MIVISQNSAQNLTVLEKIMKIALKYIALAAIAFFLNFITVRADAPPGYGKLIEHLRSSFEETRQMPLDRGLYADNLLVTHNYDPGGHVDTTKFLIGVGKELRAAKEAGLISKEGVMEIKNIPYALILL